MTRYQHEFMGIPAGSWTPRGMDPNYRGGYRGMRMRGDDRQAAYGWHRWTHEEDFAGSGGFLGRVDRPLRPSGEGGYRRPPAAYDRDWEGGGVRDLRRDPRAMREFNANSPALHPEEGYGPARYDDFARRRGPLPGHYHGERFDYANRGLSSGGYGEGWAWGPMRGAR